MGIIFDDKTISELFGHEDAENEKPERLKEYFFRNKAYDSLRAALPIRILVGHKGVGKSALLKVCFLEDQEENSIALWVRPNDVFASVDKSTDNFLQLIENWKVGISTLIVKKVLEGKDLYEDANSITKITGGIRQVIAVLSKHLSERLNLRELSESAVRSVASFLKTPSIRVYLDDLDRGWQARSEDIRNISALLNAVRDMAGENPSIQFRIGLRTDVYHLVRTSEESTDKIEANLIWLMWTNHEILTAMSKRVSTYFGETVDEMELIRRPQPEIAKNLERVLEPRFLATGHWENAPTYKVLLSLTRKRPRDLVKLFIYSAKAAHREQAKRISTAHIESIFEKYSNERLRDITNEFKTELNDIEGLLLQMRQTRRERERGIGPIFTQDQLITKIRSIISTTHLHFTNNSPINPQAIAQFLYKTDFITARIEKDGKILRRHFDENQNLQSRYADFGFRWEIHPAYRWALAPQNVAKMLSEIDLEDFD